MRKFKKKKNRQVRTGCVKLPVWGQWVKVWRAYCITEGEQRFPGHEFTELLQKVHSNSVKCRGYCAIVAEVEVTASSLGYSSCTILSRTSMPNCCPEPTCHNFSISTLELKCHLTTAGITSKFCASRPLSACSNK